MNDHQNVKITKRQSSLPFVALLLIIAFSAVTVIFLVDLTPRVETDFFFSTDDPAFQASRRIDEMFPTKPQIILSVQGSNITSEEYIESARSLTDDLLKVQGLVDVRSITRGPDSPEKVGDSPFWRRLILTDHPDTTQVIALTEDDTGSELIRDIEKVVLSHQGPDFRIEISGVPYVVELIRRHLSRDLRVFSLFALLVFGLVILVFYRSLPLVIGTLATCIGACLVTLTILHFIGTPIGILTANITTIVFVLTLSHTVFLTANWKRLRVDLESDDAIRNGTRMTFAASFWCMVTSLLGFASLLLATAKPLRELGVSGTIGTAVAIIVAYGFYPFFLRWGKLGGTTASDARNPRVPGPAATLGLVVLVGIAALGLRHLNTDPSILSYFRSGSDLRSGLELIDRGRGSIPLYLVVADPADGKLNTNEVEQTLAKLQEEIEKEPVVGSSISIPVLLAEARRVPLAAFLPAEMIVGILDSDQYAHIASSFITEDRSRALFFLRMRETARDESRQAIIARLEQRVESAGLELKMVGGLFDLQAQLGELVAASVGRQLAGLLLVFVLIAGIVARSARIAVAMVACLSAVPLLLLGTIGHFGVPLDVVAAPGTNVAIGVGIDAMIHLVMAVRRRRAQGDGDSAAWGVAVSQMTPPVIGGMSVLALGFGIFFLSSFPPTQRFGTIVAVGAMLSAMIALRVLPFVASWRSGPSDSAHPSS